MVVNRNNFGKLAGSKTKYKVTLDIQTLTMLCKYILQDARLIRMEHLVNIRNLLNMIDKSTYENDPDKIKRINFLYKALDARLENNITDYELILIHINGGLDFKVDFLDYNNILMDKSNIIYCHKMVENLLKYAFFYNDSDKILELITEFKSCDISKNISLMNRIEQEIDDVKNKFRKTHIEDNINDVYFSLDEDTFNTAVTDTYNMITSPSRRLITGMQGLNQMLGGGFESGRVYMFLGVAGVGKSLTLLNLMNQIKKYNVNINAKDITKTPCIVLLTMENTVVETITRLFDMTIDNSKGMANYELSDVLYRMRNEGGLSVNPGSPIDIVIKYKPNRSISTDYLYTLYDDLLDNGKEPVCFIQDHIKRIKSIDGSQELRIELGDIVNEFKVFAAEKDIPFITVSHLNRDATKILEESARKGSQDNGRLIGKSNTGESLLMIDNLDCGITLTKDYDKDGNEYMTFHRIKMRDRGSIIDYIAQPFLIDNPIRLVEDIGSIPQYKESLHSVKLDNNSSVRMSSSNSISNNMMNGVDNIVELDNTFSKKTYNLSPVSVNDDIFEKENDDFDNDISNLIIEESLNQQKLIENIDNRLPSEIGIKNVVTFTEPFKFKVERIDWSTYNAM